MVAAAVSLGPCSQSDCSTEEEDGIQRIDSNENQWMASQTLAPGSRDQVEQKDYREGGSEHAVMHTFGIAAGLVLQGTNEAQQNDGEDELQSAEAQTEDFGHFDLFVRNDEFAIVFNETVVRAEAGEKTRDRSIGARADDRSN